MPEDLKEYRLRKQGKVTPKSLMEGLKEWVETGDVEDLVYIVKTKDGVIMTAYSNGMNTHHIGMLEVAKVQVIESMYEE